MYSMCFNLIHSMHHRILSYSPQAELFHVYQRPVLANALPLLSPGERFCRLCHSPSDLVADSGN